RILKPSGRLGLRLDEVTISLVNWGSSLLPIWYSTPPFRIHHQAKHRMEFEWDNEYGSGSSKIMKLTITYQPDGRYLIETEHNGSPVLEVKSTYVKDNYFRVEAAGAINDVNVAVYSKVSAFLYSLCGLI
ncbi:Methylcrotonoyl-CoA carboxylase subunit alpha, mitochondrial, partial [Glycine soja]